MQTIEHHPIDIASPLGPWTTGDDRAALMCAVALPLLLVGPRRYGASWPIAMHLLNLCICDGATELCIHEAELFDSGRIRTRRTAKRAIDRIVKSGLLEHVDGHLYRLRIPEAAVAHWRRLRAEDEDVGFKYPADDPRSAVTEERIREIACDVTVRWGKAAR